MALRWFDSFDTVASSADMLLRYSSTAGSLTFTAGRTGNGIQLFGAGGANFIKLLDNQTTWIIGVGLKMIDPVSATILGLVDGVNGTTLSLQYVTGTNRLRVLRGATEIATSADGLILLGVWNYIEWKTFIDDVNGTTEVKLNGVTVLTFAGDTKNNTVGTGADRIRIGSTESVVVEFMLDDLYICDSTGAINNTFLGEIKVSTIRPTAAGDVTGLTPVGVAANWDCVNDSPSHDTDTTYVNSAVAGTRDLYQVADLTDNPATIFAVRPLIMARKDDTVTRSVAVVVKSGAVEWVGSDFVLGTSYSLKQENLLLDPTDSLAWTPAKVNAAQFGVKVTV